MGAKEYHLEGGSKSRVAADRLLSISSRGRNLGDVLDIGCGNGTLLSRFASRAHSLNGIDISADTVALARGVVPSAQLLVADIENGAPFPANSFDTIVFCDVIEHLENPVASLRAVAAMLRPGGRLLVTTPNSNSPVRYLRGKKWYGLQDPSHLIFFSAFSLRHLIEQAGLLTVSQSIEALSGSKITDGICRLLRLGGTLAFMAEKK